MRHRIFISYSHADREFARLLDASLQLADVETIRDERNLRVGDSIPSWVFDSIGKATAVAFVLSVAGLESAWLGEEIGAAKTRHLGDPDFKILPVVLDEAGVPPALRHVRAIKFLNWRDADDLRTSLWRLFDSLGVEPLLISGDEAAWWIAEHSIVAPARDTLAIAYGYFDAAVGYSHWFDPGDQFPPLRWVEKEMTEGQFPLAVAALAARIPAAAEDRRFELLRSGLAEIADWLRISRPHTRSEAHYWVRIPWVATGRVLALLTEFESAATMAVRSVSTSARAGGARRGVLPTVELNGFGIGAGADVVIAADRPGPVDVLWRRHRASGAADDLQLLLRCLGAVRGKGLAAYRERARAADVPVDPQRERRARARLDDALVEAVRTHRPELGVSVRRTAERCVDTAVSACVEQDETEVIDELLGAAAEPLQRFEPEVALRVRALVDHPLLVTAATAAALALGTVLAARRARSTAAGASPQLLRQVSSAARASAPA